MNLGPAEILVILVTALLVVGPARLPEIARKVGHGYRQLNDLQHSARRALDDAIADDSQHHAAEESAR